MRAIADYTLGLVIVMSHLFWIALSGEERASLEASR